METPSYGKERVVHILLECILVLVYLGTPLIFNEFQQSVWTHFLLEHLFISGLSLGILKNFSIAQLSLKLNIIVQYYF